MLLVVSSSPDLATDYLILRAQERSVKSVRVNTDRYPKDFSFSLKIESGCYDLALRTRLHGEFSPHDFDGVYFRQPRIPPLRFVHEDDRDFIEREVLELFRSAWRFIDKSKWLNHPENLWLASNKPKQLRRAQALGLRIPPTLVSDSSADIERFYERHGGDIVTKAITHGFVGLRDTIAVATTRRLPDDIENFLEEYLPGPAIFQPRIEKKCDLRVTVIGTNTFTAAIDSQNEPTGNVDWRRADLEGHHVKHSRYELPSRIQQLCIKLTKSFGLEFSAIDMVLSQKGEFYFLELNPNGQWAWIEQRLEYPIRDAIIDQLLDEGKTA